MSYEAPSLNLAFPPLRRGQGGFAVAGPYKRLLLLRSRTLQ